MRVIVVVVVAVFFGQLHAQVVGGQHTYSFLSLSNSARVTALGGRHIAVKDDDIALAYQNPAALNAAMHHQLSVQQSVHVAGITQGYAAYAYHLGKVPMTLHAGIQHIAYGKFQRSNNLGELEGTFNAGELAINIGAAYQASERLSFGTNQKFISSQLEGARSAGWASDWAMMYEDTAKRINVTFVLKNLGTQFTTYFGNGNYERLPFDAQLGFSHRLKHAPVRFSIIGHHLHRWNVRYDDPALEEDGLFLTAGEPVPSNRPTAGEVVDNIFRHLTFNMEFLLGKGEVFRIRVGYDRMRQGELGVQGLRTMAGFSGGVGIRVYKFRIDYGLMAYHIGGTAHHFGISTNLSSF